VQSKVNRSYETFVPLEKKWWMCTLVVRDSWALRRYDDGIPAQRFSGGPLEATSRCCIFWSSSSRICSSASRSSIVFLVLVFVSFLSGPKFILAEPGTADANNSWRGGIKTRLAACWGEVGEFRSGVELVGRIIVYFPTCFAVSRWLKLKRK